MKTKTRKNEKKAEVVKMWQVVKVMAPGFEQVKEFETEAEADSYLANPCNTYAAISVHKQYMK